MRVKHSFLLLLLLLLLIGCGDDPTPTLAPDPTSTSSPTAAADDTDDEAPAVVQNSDRDFGSAPSFSLDDVPTLAELIETYPELGDLLQGQDLSDPTTVRTLYDQMVNLYQSEGIAGLNVFLKDSGLSEQLGMDSSYIDYLMVYEDEGVESAENLARERNLINSDDQLRLVIVLEDGASLASIQPLLDQNNIVVLGTAQQDVIVGIPLTQLAAAQSSDEVMAQLLAITQHESVSGIRVPPTGFTNQRSGFVGQGVENTGADGWQAAGITGEGVRVAVVDGGFGGFLDLVGTDLPDEDNLFIHPDNDANYLDQFTDPHGAATAEIVHDMAPDAQLFLVHPETLYDYFDLMDWLVAQEIDIVSHSVGFPVEPIDGTGAVAQLINDYRDEFVWINASGNYALSHLDMRFRDNDDDDLHDFPDGEELLPIAPLGPGNISLALQWDGPNEGGADHDYDIFILNEAGDVLASSRNPQNGNRRDLPFEIVSYYVSSSDILYVAIENSGAETNKRMNLVGNGVDFKYSMPEGSLASPSDAEYAVAVGATYWRDDSLESYSSQGPTWDNRVKPDLSAPSRVDSVTYGSPFAGTSASAPHVAGAAALILSANAGMRSADLRTTLTDGAFDLGASGLDSEFGAGRVDLGDPPTGAVAVVPDPTAIPTDPPAPTDVPADDPTIVPTAAATDAPTTQPIGSDDEPFVTFDIPFGFEMTDSRIEAGEGSYSLETDTTFFGVRYEPLAGDTLLEFRDEFTDELEANDFVVGDYASVTVDGLEGYAADVSTESDGELALGQLVVFGTDETVLIALGLAESAEWEAGINNDFVRFVRSIEVNETGLDNANDPDPTPTPAVVVVEASPTPTPLPTTTSSGGSGTLPQYEADEIVINNAIGISIFLPSSFEQEVVEDRDVTRLFVSATNGPFARISISGGLDDSSTAIEDNFDGFKDFYLREGFSVGEPEETTVSLLYGGLEANVEGPSLGNDGEAIFLKGRIVVFGEDNHIVVVEMLMEETLWDATGESLYEEITDFIFLFPPE